MSGAGAAACLDALSDEDARRALARCCASPAWVEGMLARRPFGTDAALEAAASAVEADLDRDDWLAAFAAHARIGDRPASAWSRAEQAGTVTASTEVLAHLRRANADYEARFGHVFLICATGLEAAVMVEALDRRMDNDPEAELRVAAAEQAKITRLRLAKLAAETTAGDPR